jgi:hypothetical protein
VNKDVDARSGETERDGAPDANAAARHDPDSST